MRLRQMAGALTLSTLTSLFYLSPAQAVDCDALKSAKILDTTIISAEAVPAGDLTTEDKVTRKNMPAFCRVVASVKDAPDSDVRVELWMPNEGWKGVFHVNGNGGYAGVLAYNYGAMEAAIKRGYASAETDLGMAPASPLNGDALVGHPDKWKDWGMLGTHEAAVAGKQIAKAFYGADAKRSYYTGCSTGGQQGLIEAEYFPEDFDGILAGAPVVSRTWGHAVAVTSFQAANLKPGHKLSDANLALLTKSAIAACGAKGGGLKSDPFLADPLACDFDPAALTCKGAAADDCLTPEQVETAKAIYLGPADHNGKPLFYGEQRGAEAGVFNWGFLQAPGNAPGEPGFDGLFKWVFGPNWDWRTFDAEFRHEEGRRRARAGAQRRRDGRRHEVSRPWREADPLPGLGRSDRSDRADCRFLQGPHEQVRRRREDERVRAALHGPRHRPLRHRRGIERVRTPRLSAGCSRRASTPSTIFSSLFRTGSRTASRRIGSSRRNTSATMRPRASRCSGRSARIRSAPGTRATETPTPPRISFAPSTRSERR